MANFRLYALLQISRFIDFYREKYHIKTVPKVINK